jgi:hypothetical protein
MVFAALSRVPTFCGMHDCGSSVDERKELLRIAAYVTRDGSVSMT